MRSPPTLLNGNLYGSVYGTGSQLFELQPPSTPGGSWTTTTSGANIRQPPTGAVYSIAPK